MICSALNSVKSARLLSISDFIDNGSEVPSMFASMMNHCVSVIGNGSPSSNSSNQLSLTNQQSHLDRILLAHRIQQSLKLLLTLLSFLP